MSETKLNQMNTIKSDSVYMKLIFEALAGELGAIYSVNHASNTVCGAQMMEIIEQKIDAEAEYQDRKNPELF